MRPFSAKRLLAVTSLALCFTFAPAAAKAVATPVDGGAASAVAASSADPQTLDPIDVVLGALADNDPEPHTDGAIANARGRYIGCRADGSSAARCFIFAITGTSDVTQ